MADYNVNVPRSGTRKQGNVWVLVYKHSRKINALREKAQKN